MDRLTIKEHRGVLLGITKVNKQMRNVLPEERIAIAHMCRDAVVSQAAGAKKSNIEMAKPGVISKVETGFMGVEVIITKDRLQLHCEDYMVSNQKINELSVIVALRGSDGHLVIIGNCHKRNHRVAFVLDMFSDQQANEVIHAIQLSKNALTGSSVHSVRQGQPVVPPLAPIKESTFEPQLSTAPPLAGPTGVIPKSSRPAASTLPPPPRFSLGPPMFHPIRTEFTHSNQPRLPEQNPSTSVLESPQGKLTNTKPVSYLSGNVIIASNPSETTTNPSNAYRGNIPFPVVSEIKTHQSQPPTVHATQSPCLGFPTNFSDQSDSSTSSPDPPAPTTPTVLLLNPPRVTTPTSYINTTNPFTATFTAPFNTVLPTPYKSPFTPSQFQATAKFTAQHNAASSATNASLPMSTKVNFSSPLPHSPFALVTPTLSGNTGQLPTQLNPSQNTFVHNFPTTDEPAQSQYGHSTNITNHQSFVAPVAGHTINPDAETSAGNLVGAIAHVSSDSGTMTPLSNSPSFDMKKINPFPFVQLDVAVPHTGNSEGNLYGSIAHVSIASGSTLPFPNPSSFDKTTRNRLPSTQPNIAYPPTRNSEGSDILTPMIRAQTNTSSLAPKKQDNENAAHPYLQEQHDTVTMQLHSNIGMPIQEQYDSVIFTSQSNVDMPTQEQHGTATMSTQLNVGMSTQEQYNTIMMSSKSNIGMPIQEQYDTVKMSTPSNVTMPMEEQYDTVMMSSQSNIGMPIQEQYNTVKMSSQTNVTMPIEEQYDTVMMSSQTNVTMPIEEQYDTVMMSSQSNIGMPIQEQNDTVKMPSQSNVTMPIEEQYDTVMMSSQSNICMPIQEQYDTVKMSSQTNITMPIEEQYDTVMMSSQTNVTMLIEEQYDTVMMSSQSNIGMPIQEQHNTVKMTSQSNVTMPLEEQYDTIMMSSQSNVDIPVQEQYDTVTMSSQSNVGMPLQDQCDTVTISSNSSDTVSTTSNEAAPPIPPHHPGSVTFIFNNPSATTPLRGQPTSLHSTIQEPNDSYEVVDGTQETLEEENYEDPDADIKRQSATSFAVQTGPKGSLSSTGSVTSQGNADFGPPLPRRNIDNQSAIAVKCGHLEKIAPKVLSPQSTMTPAPRNDTQTPGISSQPSLIYGTVAGTPAPPSVPPPLPPRPDIEVKIKKKFSMVFPKKILIGKNKTKEKNSKKKKEKSSPHDIKHINPVPNENKGVYGDYNPGEKFQPMTLHNVQPPIQSPTPTTSTPPTTSLACVPPYNSQIIDDSYDSDDSEYIYEGDEYYTTLGMSILDAERISSKLPARNVAQRSQSLRNDINNFLTNEYKYLGSIERISKARSSLSPQMQTLLRGIETLYDTHNTMYGELYAAKSSCAKIANVFISYKKDLEVYKYYMLNAPQINNNLKELSEILKQTYPQLEDDIRGSWKRLHYYFMTLERMLASASDEDKKAVTEAVEMLRDLHLQADSGILIDSVKDAPLDLHLYSPLILHHCFRVTGPGLKGREFRVLLFKEIVVMTLPKLEKYDYQMYFRIEQTNFVPHEQEINHFSLEVDYGGGTGKQIYHFKAQDEHIKEVWVNEITKLQEDHAEKVKQERNRRFGIQV